MKKIIILLFIICAFALPTYAVQEQSGEKEKIIEGEVIELEPQPDTIMLDELQAEKPSLETGISKYYTFDKGIFKVHINDYINFDFGAIGDMSWNVNSDENVVHSKFFFPTTDFILSGKINEHIDYKAQMFADRNIDEQTILGDLFVRGKYKNYTAQVGRFRRNFGYEPTYSLYDNDFASKSQITNRFGDDRDTGVKLIADYKYADISLGLYANMQNRPFDFSNRGIEFDSYLTFKPLANYPEKGELRIGGGVATGKKDYAYTNFGGLLSYRYKRFGLVSEYIYKQAAVFDEKTVDGFYVNGTYFITDKLQATLRFDSFNPDTNHSSSRTNNYVAGLNYYFNKRNTMLVLNYIFSDGVIKSHRVALQLRYRTW